MELWEYPRPPGDNGIGVHWSAGYPAMLGMGKIREQWLPELKAMGVKWVKFLHDGGEGFAELLLKNDIMPIVRLYRPQPNPSVLGKREIEFLERYLKIGVRYFEFNNEPDLSVEWRSGQLPENAIDLVAENAIIDMETILEKGGYPAVPTLAVGTKWDLVGKICDLGGDYLFEGGVWQAIHNYVLNHPLDYPYDDVNLKGAPVSRQEYDRLAAQQGQKDMTAWDSDTLEMVNARRRSSIAPSGVTISDDPSAWRSYEFYDLMARQHLGRSIPVLSTEGGVNVGDRADLRYPRLTYELHKEMTLEMCRVMMGVSKRFEKAPDYYFCTALWLLGNFTLGHYSTWWESQAWYSPNWPNGRLPTVEALKAEPKRERPPISRERPRRGGIRGRVLDGGAGHTLVLKRGEQPLKTTTVEDDGTYRFSRLEGGRYNLTVKGKKVEKDGLVTDGQKVVTANLSMLTNSAVIKGVVKGGAGRKLILSSNGQAQETVIAKNGAYQFTDLPAGRFSLFIEDTHVGQRDIETDGHSTVVVNLDMPLWTWKISSEAIGGGISIVRCSVIDRRDLPVKLYIAGSGWEGMTGRTGTKPEYGEFACEFAPLQEATYRLEPEGLSVVAEFELPQGTIATVEFVEQPPVEEEEAEEPVEEEEVEEEEAEEPVEEEEVEEEEAEEPIEEEEVEEEEAEGLVEEGEEEIEEEQPLKDTEHYLLIGKIFRDQKTFLAVIRYAAHFSPVAGSSIEEAKRAYYVTILGDSKVVSPAVEKRLQKAGCQVERIDTRIAETLEKLVNEDQPFVTLEY